MTKKKTPTPEPTVIEFESFRPIGNMEMVNLRQVEPSSVNGWIRIRKYKITCEPIEESIEVYQERLQLLWDTCDNHRNWQPIKIAAERLGLTLIGNAGSKRK